MSSEEPFVNINEVAQYFSVSTSTVRSWIEQDLIPRDTFIKLGNTYRFQISAVTRALTSASAELSAAPEETPDEIPDDGDDMAATHDDDDMAEDL